tara:strand:- start:166 stop:411 length:246 start_codon:yes stop_codon:yes gene_type:complete
LPVVLFVVLRPSQEWEPSTNPARFKLAEPRFPGVERRRRHPVLPGPVGHRGSGLVLLQHPMICSSLNLLRFMSGAFSWAGF